MGWGLRSVLRASLRSGWRPLVGLALLIGLACGALITGFEASRRTDTAFDRMVEATNAWDVLVNPDEGTTSDLTFDMIADLPMVEQAGRYDGVYMAPVHVGGFDELDEGFLVGASDGVAGYEIGGPANLQGRLPDPDAVDEVFLSARAAELNDLEVGDHYVGRILSDELFVALEQAVSEEEALALLNSDDFGERVELEIVGTGAFFDEVVVDSGFSTGSMMVTPAFWEASRRAVGRFLRCVRRAAPRCRGRRLPRRGGGDGARGDDRLPDPTRRSRPRPSGPSAPRWPPSGSSRWSPASSASSSSPRPSPGGSSSTPSPTPRSAPWA